MLSKEEIEKAKNILKEIQESNRSWLFNTNEENCEKIYLQDIEAIETLLQYIDQLKQENNKQNKIIDEMCEQLAGLAILDIKKAEYITLGDKEEVKQYFEKKVEKK